MEGSKEWAAVAVTCKTKSYANAIRKEFDLRQHEGALPKDVIFLCVSDPQEGLGSGGATVNALLMVAEYLSVKNGLTVVSSDVIENMRILIIHMGRFYSYDPCGRAFVCLPSQEDDGEHENFITNFDLLFRTISQQLNAVSPPGVWICSSDMIFTVPKDLDIDLKEQMNTQGVCCISVPASVEYARSHGVYKINDKGLITDIIYKGTDEQIKSCLLPTVPGNDSKSASLVSGIVFFSSQTASKLLSLHDCAPLDACTYLGIDSGFEPLQISLFFDILLSMAKDVLKSDFVSGKRGSSFGNDGSNFRNKNMQQAREVLWEKFQGTELKAVVIPSGKHYYLEMVKTPLNCISLLKEQCRLTNSAIGPVCKAAFIYDGCNVGNGSIVINSLIGDDVTVGSDCLISHCHLKGGMTIGNNCYVLGLDEDSCELLQDFVIPDNSFLMGLNIAIEGLGGKKVFCCLKDCHKFSICDDLNQIIVHNSRENMKEAVTYGDLLRAVNCDAAQFPPKEHTSYFMAKIFPVVNIVQKIDVRDCIGLLQNSISVSAYTKWKLSWKLSLYDLLEQTDHIAEFSNRLDITIKIHCAKIRDDLLGNKGNSLQNYYSLAILKKKHDILLSMLDEVALTCVEEDKTHLCTRVFACIAEVLAKVAGENAGLRSGPAANREWRKALLMLERGEFKNGIIALSSVRSRWLNDTDKLIRAARHYERAEHIFVRHACLSVAKFITTSPGGMIDTHTWLVCDSPARIDLSGGWTDTPPICYEHGGIVINVALMLEDKRPIGSRVRFIDDPAIVLTTHGSNKASVVCDTLESFRDYCLPQAPGALLKACIILCEIFSLDSKLTLKEQLMMRYGKGIEIQTWSQLPRGSGLGTSSILAGVVIYALFRAVGRVADTRSVIHAVLLLEQMMTTGGGWQDQVGGMVGGIKRCSSEAKLPLEIYSRPLSVSDEFLRDFENRIKLIYTGITRLARNMLQDVLRNWYVRKPNIITNCRNLVSNAHKCEEAFLNGDLVTLGECINEYWKQKKIMAPGCEPASCARIMEKLAPLVLGQTLAGAAGGGFLFVLLKEPQTNEYLMNLLKYVKGADDIAIYKATVDLTGVQLSYQSIE